MGYILSMTHEEQHRGQSLMSMSVLISYESYNTELLLCIK